MADPGEERVPSPLVQDDAQVAGDAGGPEVGVSRAVDAVEGEAGCGGVDLEVEGGLLRRGLFLGGQAVEGGGESVGDAEGHKREDVPDFGLGLERSLKLETGWKQAGFWLAAGCDSAGVGAVPGHVKAWPGHTANTFMTSSPRWLMTLTAMRPDLGRGKGRETVALRLSQASSSISAFKVVRIAL
jgi:hypothetical protein